MPTKSNSRLIRITQAFLDLLLALGIVGCALLALWLLISPLAMAGGKKADVAVPVVIGSRSILPVVSVEITAPGQESIHSPCIVKARGELRFQTSSWSLHFASMLVYLIAVLVITSVVYLIRSVLREVAQGNPFGPKNAKRIRAIGLLFLLVGTLGPVVEHVVARMVLARIPTTDPVLSAPLSFESGPILTGLLILTLAQVWAYGSDIEREQALTI
jgi:hypothetical protein